MPNFTIIQLPIPSPHPQPSCPAAASLHWVAHVESLHDTGSRHKLIILLLPSSVGLSVWICSIWKFEWASKNMQWKWSRFQYLDFQTNEPINFWIIVCGSLIRQMFDDKLVNRAEIKCWPFWNYKHQLLPICVATMEQTVELACSVVGETLNKRHIVQNTLTELINLLNQLKCRTHTNTFIHAT